MDPNNFASAVRKLTPADPHTGSRRVVIEWADGFRRPVTVFMRRCEYAGSPPKVIPGTWVPMQIHDAGGWNTTWDHLDVVAVLPWSEWPSDTSKERIAA